MVAKRTHPTIRDLFLHCETPYSLELKTEMQISEHNAERSLICRTSKLLPVIFRLAYVYSYLLKKSYITQ